MKPPRLIHLRKANKRMKSFKARFFLMAGILNRRAKNSDFFLY
jgi:hypothetical protein